jgi:hypothetical protein
MMHEKLIRELFMEKYQANVKKSHAKPINPKFNQESKEMTALKTPNNSDKFSNQSNLFDENNKFPFHNSSMPKNEPVNQKKNF